MGQRETIIEANRQMRLLMLDSCSSGQREQLRKYIRDVPLVSRRKPGNFASIGQIIPGAIAEIKKNAKKHKNLT